MCYNKNIFNYILLTHHNEIHIIGVLLYVFNMERKKEGVNVLKTKDLTTMSLFIAMMAVTSWISIPFFSIPITLQTFGVSLTLLFLGGRKGTLVILMYILLGAIGIPVFASFRGGLGVLIGPTGGYIIGFILMGLIYLVLTENIKTENIKSKDNTKVKTIALAIGLIAVYAVGTLQFKMVSTSTDKGMLSILALCVFPYIIPDIVKIWVAFKVDRRFKKAVN